VTYRSDATSPATVQVERATIVRVTDTEALDSAPTWTLYAGLTVDGRGATWITGSELPRAVQVNCTPGAGAPVLRVCGGIDDHGPGGSVLVGRVRAPIATVEARDAAGRTLHSALRNGYFMLPSRRCRAGSSAATPPGRSSRPRTSS